MKYFPVFTTVLNVIGITYMRIHSLWSSSKVI